MIKVLTNIVQLWIVEEVSHPLVDGVVEIDGSRIRLSHEVAIVISTIVLGPNHLVDIAIIEVERRKNTEALIETKLIEEAAEVTRVVTEIETEQTEIETEVGIETESDMKEETEVEAQVLKRIKKLRKLMH